MPMMPATEPLTPMERLRVENAFQLVSKFKDFSNERKVQVLQQVASHAPRLYAEVLRLEEHVSKNYSDAGLVEENQRISSDLYAMTVERDNLKKMLEDANQREEVQLGIVAEMRRRWPLVVEQMEKPDPLQDVFPDGGSPT